MVAVSRRRERTGQNSRDGCLPVSGAIAPVAERRWGSAGPGPHPGEAATTAPAQGPAWARRSMPPLRSLYETECHPVLTSIAGSKPGPCRRSPGSSSWPSCRDAPARRRCAATVSHRQPVQGRGMQGRHGPPPLPRGGWQSRQLALSDPWSDMHSQRSSPDRTAKEAARGLPIGAVVGGDGTWLVIVSDLMTECLSRFPERA